MTKDLLYTLSTGDVVTNTKTKEKKMVFVMTSTSNTISIDKLTDFEDWELTKARTFITEGELRELAEYHKKMEENSK